ncbi:MAG: DUF433 domain-containing protein [Polyangiaceae bacterium]|nr:DUF433 domain-containing protein [Polyangiaceae bacterium]
MPVVPPVASLPIILIPHPHVRVDKKALAGSPHVVGTRIPVRRLYAFYKNGTPMEKILKRYPQLSPAKIFDALAFALDNPEVMEADMAREADMLAQRDMKRPKRLPGLRQVQLPFMQGGQSEDVVAGKRGA